MSGVPRTHPRPTSSDALGWDPGGRAWKAPRGDSAMQGVPGSSSVAVALRTMDCHAPLDISPRKPLRWG